MTTAQRAYERTNVLYDEIASRRTEVGRAHEYYEGKQPLKYASEKWRESFAARYRDFADNWCGPVADASNERLKVIGFRIGEGATPSAPEKALWDDWITNDMEAQSSQGFLSGIIARRSYVHVWGSPDDEPVITWERADQFTIGYDPENPLRPIDQLKTWHDGSTEYATYTTATEVFKWQRPYLSVTSAGSGIATPPRGAGFFETPAGLVVPSPGLHEWQPREVDDAWPIRNPLGELPGVEMPNRPILGGQPLSEIAGTMAMQDAINILWGYLFTQADFAGMPARVVMGQEAPKVPVLDENGQKIGEREVPLKKLAEDRILWLTGDKAQIGQWEASNLSIFTDTVSVAVSHIAAQTRTPPHYLILGKGMVNVNAEGMKAAETGLAKKVDEMHLFLTPPVRRVFRKMALVRGDASVAEQCRRGTPSWQDSETRSEGQLVDALGKLSALRFPFRWIAERYGLSKPEIDRIMKMREDEARQDPLLDAVRNAGQAPPATDPAADSNPSAQ